MRHWRLDEDGDYLIATLDVAESSVNVLTQEVLQELDGLIGAVEGRESEGLIIRSAKANGFIVGADVREFERLEDAGGAAELARVGQQVFNRLAALPLPTAAVIHGNCLGGGLELALACNSRIAREDEATRLGLPEVRLGIHPGFAGTVRLPPLIGPLAALDLMLSGRSIGARQAKRLGLVDDAVPERHLLHAARTVLARGRGRRRARLGQRLPGWWPLRAVVHRRVVRQLRRRVNPDHYPAPYRIAELWRGRAGQEQEAQSLGELLVSRTSRNLVHVFLLGEELKRQGRAHAHEIERVHVIGAGIMGGDIASWCAHQGFTVSLQDQSPEIIGQAVRRAHEFFRRRLREPRAAQAAMDRLMPDLAGDGLARADLVIEAIVERADAKQALLRTLESRVPRATVLATNTSSIPLETLATALKDPSRLVGLHFFNPVARMQLIEIVRGPQSAARALDRAAAFCVAIDKLPLPVRSSPGFLVNRILMPYLMEAVALVEEGVPLAAVDRAATDFGMPMGPIELADTVGLDICLAVAESLSGPLGLSVPERLRAMVESGQLGKKTRSGFYRYDAAGRARRRRRIERHTEVPVTERLILRMLNEAMACLREQVVADAEAVDAGMVYGTGFAPYLGGPMRYAESMGATGISHSLYRLSEEYGGRFAPDPGWSQAELLARRPAT